MKYVALSVVLLSGCLLGESDGECDAELEPNSHACRVLAAAFDADGGGAEQPDSTILPGLSSCTDVFIGSQTGLISSGRLTAGRESPCQSGRSILATRVEWVAPFAGQWQVDTIGSDFDTVLGVRSGSCSDSVSCDDDGGENGSSASRFSSNAGDRFVFHIEGYEGTRGNYRLSVRAN